MTPDVPAWALDLLREARVGRLATADARGRPLVVPVCFAFAGDVIYSAIDAKPKRDPSRPLRRLRNIGENPRVALVVDHYDEDWTRLRYVIVEGTATILTAGDEFARAIDLLRDKYPPVPRDGSRPRRRHPHSRGRRARRPLALRVAREARQRVKRRTRKSGS